jgi:surface antigen
MRIRRRSDRRASLTRRAGFVLVLGLLTAVAPLLHPESVSAASGVDDYPSRLRNAAQDSLVDPWLFYNRECTSFVAWRLNSENQVAFDNYWQGEHWGNASNWRNAALAAGVPVDNNPTRGAVAWWRAGSAGSSRGHVAWVQTVGDGAITIEEYNYLHAGRYDTRTISSSSSLWPSGFLHVKDTQIRNTTSPTVVGDPQVGERLKATRGTWSGAHLTYTFRWLANGRPIAGATSKSFTPSADELGKKIRAKVTATKAGAHAGTAQSAPTDGVAKGVFVNTEAPAVRGKAQVGLPVAADRGSWSPTGTFGYQWFAAGEPIEGATGARYTPTPAQLGQGLKVRVSLSAPGYRTLRQRSDPTPGVVPGQFEAETPPSISGVAQVDQPLSAAAGTWTPSGTISYQWLVDGKPIDGATGTGYTPTPDDLRKNVAIRVTVHRRGYDDAVTTSVATTRVAPGTFLNTAAPSIDGTAQVGVPLTAAKGSWSPRATISYQWVADGQLVPGATEQTFTPRPQDLGTKISVEVTATRLGYLAAAVPSAPTTATLPGVITNHRAPVVSGRAVVGHRLRSTDGSWSLTPDGVRYQWYAGHTPISGATHATYVVTGAEAGRRIHVVVTARHDGYTRQPAASDATDRVVFGRISFAKPTVRGHAVVGRTLRARLDDVAPSSATPHFHWYRDDQPIRGARDASYVVRTADLGHSLHVVVTMRAQNWVTRVKRSVSVTDVRTRPRLHPHTSLRDGRVFLRLVVRAPGLSELQGAAKVWLGGHRVGRFNVSDGRGSRLLAAMKHGRHTLTVVYHGGVHETVGRTSVTVTVP